MPKKKGGEKLNKQLKQFTWEVKILDEANRIIEMIGSTENNDRVGDKMLMAGANLQNYLKNPVVLANHCYGEGEKSSVIGRSLSVVIQSTQMIFKIQFAETDNGKEWFYLYANKYMNASSIGFIPIKYAPNDQGGYDFTEWELLELSMVAVPCNPQAVQRAFDDGKISKAFFDTINKNKEDIENMKVEEVQALIEKAVDSKVTEIQKTHATELETKVKEIEGLAAKIKELEGQIEIKGGASHSKTTVDTINSCCKGIMTHIKTMQDMVGCGDGEDPKGKGQEEEKDYSEEDIQKAVQERIEKALEGGTK